MEVLRVPYFYLLCQSQQWMGYRVHINEDSALHDPLVARELTKLMMLPWDIEELKSQTMGKVMNGIFPIIVKVSLL